MDFNCRRKLGCLKKFCAYCCTYKRDLLKNNNFEKTIEILPRVLVYEKMKKCATYHQQLTVRNTGTLLRRLKFIVEPNSDVSFIVNGNTDLISGAYVSVDIYVEPICKKKFINRNRFFYILAEHPDIVWEIPILVIEEPPEVFIPEIVCLHKVPANTVSNYQFVIYNPLENEVTFSICSNFEDLTVIPTRSNVKTKDYCTVLISCKIANQIKTTSLIVILNNAKSYQCCVHMEPTEQIVHLSTSVLNFEDTYMGLKDQKNLHICNKSMESASFQWSCNEVLEDAKTSDKADEELIISEFLRIRNKRGCIPGMNSALSIATFSPPANINCNEEEEPPFKINIGIYLFCPILGPHSYRLQINANILGPDIEILPKEIDLGNIYMGEIQCLTFQATNKGPISGEIYFKEYTDQNEIRCSLTPLSIYLNPNACGSFQLTLYRRDIGKFLTKLVFKIKSGNSIPILLRGMSLAAKVKIWPEVFEFGKIPICIPQKRFALVVNPLPVPIVVEPTVVDDGTEDPMILCVDYSKLPLHVRSATYYNLKGRQGQGDHDELHASYSTFASSERRASTNTETSSQLSWMFQDKVLDDIPVMAEELLQNVSNLHSQNQPESGMKIIDAALDCILDRSDYFEDLKDKQNYLRMDWKALPSDAKEIAMEEERFYLKPNESKSFPVILIPNSSGPSTKIIHFKACPMGIENSDLKTAIRSKYMEKALQLQYKCIIPAIIYNENVKFDKPLYVDMETIFEMKFKNIDVVPGFLYFIVIPNSANGAMKVEESQKKFFISPDEEVAVACSVIFRQTGNVILHGMFRLMGKLMEYPFNVEADVIPPTIEITPEKLLNKQQVLDFTTTNVIIENICPTVATFSLSLKTERYQSLQPSGGSLAPNQSILISVFSKYFDPGMYKNVIYINLKHAEKLSIPIIFTVEGTPLKFEPNIKFGLDCGTIFKNEGNRNRLIKIMNFGEKSYRLLFQKQKPKVQLIPMVFSMQQNGITLAPNSEGTVQFILDTSKDVSVEEDYAVDGMGEDNYRFKFFTFTAKCTIIKSNVIWSKSNIFLEMGNDDESKEKISDTISLINTTPLSANVSLNVSGFFLIGDEATESMEKSLSFCLDKKAVKQLIVSINTNEIDEQNICQCFEGSVKCKVNSKKQKSLLLYAKIVNPGLKICTSQVTFFTPNAESYAHINIHNSSAVKAIFTWKRTELRRSKNIYPQSYETSSKTISERILNLPKESFLKMPTSIKPQEPVNCSYEDDVLDEDVLKRKKSFPQNLSSKQRGSKSLIVRKASEPIIVFEPKPYKPVQFLTQENIKSYQVAIKQILDYLEVAEPMSLESTKTDTGNYKLDKTDTKYDSKDTFNFEENSPVIFQQNSGCIFPKTIFTAYMFLPPVADGDTLFSKFELEVISGQTETFDVTVTSLKGRIEIAKTDIDFGNVMWHKTLTGKIKLTNRSPYAVKISLIKNPEASNVEQQLINGHVEFISPKVFVLMPKMTTNIEWEALLGLQNNFNKDLGVEVNNTTAIPIHFKGQGFMPMIVPKNFNQMSRKPQDSISGYLSMSKVFAKFDGENLNSKVIDELVSSESKSIFNEIGGGGLNSSSRVSRVSRVSQKRKTKQYIVPSDFVLLNYPEKLGPAALEIECLTGKWKFLANLDESEDLRKKLHQFYSDCIFRGAMEFDPVINLKLTICRPIPWELPAFILNIGEVNINQTKSLNLDIIFVGPGKVFLSVRTRAAIPGLTAWFEDFINVGFPSPFVFFLQSPDERTLKKYKNMNERNPDDDSIDTEKSVRLPHCHSYDIDETGVHNRKRISGELKKSKEHYTKLNQPFRETKNRLILAEICQTTEENWQNTTFELTLLFTAMSEFYRNGQLIEDYLLIDVHLGPTLPILLQGKVVNSRKDEV